jgi:diaminohydroxyphosphoribosylaminopyrimidine deaminase/5-amino-6-(5-phosphoribosylamino)uracil reductase
VKVVACTEDPNPLVAGRGFKLLQNAGITTEVGILSHEARELNLGFFSRMIRQMPWVRLKVATSIDGFTALANGESQWITSEPARIDGHYWRARSCAVLTGIGTILNDNPRLDVRHLSAARQPHLVIVDSSLRLPIDAALHGVDRKIFLYCAHLNPQKQNALASVGVTVIYMPNSLGQVDLEAMLRDLAARSVNELHVEAGNTLNGALMSLNLADELLLYMAPKILGSGIGMAKISPLLKLQDAAHLELKDVSKVGTDIRILARWPIHDQF